MRRADKVGDRIFTDGNSAAALGCVYGGATVAAWYPITPSSSVAEAFQKYCDKFRVDPGTGRSNFAIVQAEDELASIGMVVGAGWNGARAFTATSGPGISLMTEFIGLAYFAEIPVTIINVQRGGPSTGMPTRTQQSDLLSCAYASHGDTKHVLLFPEDPAECFERAAAALDLADRLQTPVFLMTDLDIGMNQRLCKPFAWDDARPYDRGKVMNAAELEAGKDFGRYKDVDGDGIPWRTYPGTHPTKGGFFTRGTTRDPYARYSERGPDYIYNMERLLRQIPHRRRPGAPARAAQRRAGRRRFGVIYFGSTSPAMQEALDVLTAAGIHIDAMRLRAFPFPDSVDRFIAAHEQVFVVEQNRDAQMRALLVNELDMDPARLVTMLHYDGTPITARFIARGDSDPSARRPAVAQGGRMTYLAKPRLHHPTLTHNEVGYTRRDYEGRISTLCAGCGHDSISAAIIQACWELDIEPHRVAKLSGIGCSSKTPDYFLGASHGFNTVHGRMPSVLTGANLANRDLLYLGVSGDGDSASIGLGQFANAMRRGVHMAYIVENNGVYGLTKGQFSATADRGSRSKKGVVNSDSPMDLVGLALQLGATYVARSFSGDKEQLVPLIKGAIGHGGAAFIDVISPCVTFNNHGGSTKSYDYVRQHNEAVSRIDFMPRHSEITAQYAPGEVIDVQQHDGSLLRLRKLHTGYDPTDRYAALSYMNAHQARGEVVTGLLYLDPQATDLHLSLNTSDTPLNSLGPTQLCPGAKALEKINASLR